MESRSEYLAFGGTDIGKSLDLQGTKDFLESRGYGNGELGQARSAMAARKEEQFTFDALGAHYCDFCFTRIMGGEYDVLKDGRERCSRCSRTVLSTHEQFVDEFQQVRLNMELAFGINLSTPLIVKMVNAREIARRTGETFVPTGGVDPRVLGYATKTRRGHELYIENGSPRMAAITTMAHELTHVWQFTTWDDAAIVGKYGRRNRLAVGEGMATWVQVQYLLYIRDFDYAHRQHAYLLAREDEYGDGYRVYLERYPLSMDGDVRDESPFLSPLPL